MAEQGFEVTVNYEDQSITGTDAGQEEAYDNAIVVCRQAAVDAGLDAAPAPYTDEELELIYDAYLVIGACLEEHGFSTPPAPSREAFLDGQTNPWHPYGALATPDSIASAEVVCPQDIRPIIAELLLEQRGR